MQNWREQRCMFIYSSLKPGESWLSSYLCQRWSCCLFFSAPFTEITESVDYSNWLTYDNHHSRATLIAFNCFRWTGRSQWIWTAHQNYAGWVELLESSFIKRFSQLASFYPRSNSELISFDIYDSIYFTMFFFEKLFVELFVVANTKATIKESLTLSSRVCLVGKLIRIWNVFRVFCVGTTFKCR